MSAIVSISYFKNIVIAVKKVFDNAIGLELRWKTVVNWVCIKLLDDRKDILSTGVSGVQ